MVRSLSLPFPAVTGSLHAAGKCTCRLKLEGMMTDSRIKPPGLAMRWYDLKPKLLYLASGSILTLYSQWLYNQVRMPAHGLLLIGIWD